MINNEDKQINEAFEQLAEYGASAKYEKKLKRAIDYIDDIFDEDLLSYEQDEAMRDCFFMPWFLFHWTEYRYRTGDGTKTDPNEQPIACHFLQEKKHTLSDYQQTFIKQMLDSYYSYYAVVELTPDNKAIYLDIFLGTRYTIAITNATKYFELGDIIFGCIISINSQPPLVVSLVPFCVTDSLDQIIAVRRLLIEQHGVLTASKFRDEYARGHLSWFFMTLDDLLRGNFEDQDEKSEENEREAAEWLEKPEVQEKLKAVQTQSLSEWPNIKMEELNGLTPTQAIKTAEGKKIVEDLLLEWELKRPVHPNIRPNVASLRKELGIDS